MLIGLFLLLSSLLFGGNPEVFYIDKIENGVKKFVTDKDRKKELDDVLKDYNNSVKEFHKTRDGYVKQLKSKSLDRNTPDQWYKDFFEARLVDRKNIHAEFIDQRIKLQENITDDEWAQIMDLAKETADKLAEKREKQKEKEANKNYFKKQEQAITDHISDPNRQTNALKALKSYEQDFVEVAKAYEELNVNEAEFLDDRYATREDMQKLSDQLNSYQADLYASYRGFIRALIENTNEEEWGSIIKVFNQKVS